MTIIDVGDNNKMAHICKPCRNSSNKIYNSENSTSLHVNALIIWIYIEFWNFDFFSLVKNNIIIYNAQLWLFCVSNKNTADMHEIMLQNPLPANRIERANSVCVKRI